MWRRSGIILAGATGIGGAYVALDPELGEEAKGIVSGTVRFSRAVYHSCAASADYKRTLKGLEVGSPEYEVKRAEVNLRVAQRFLKVCMAHGGLYTKFGQHIASMNHILPPQFIETLSALQDQNPSVSVQEVERTILRELGATIPEIFSEFDEKAIAAASLAQVHRAVTKTGKEVAVKLQYPGLESQVARDLRTMRLLATAMGYVFPDYEYTWLFPEFEATVTLELDFVQEGTNCERVGRMFRGRKDVCVPGIHWEYTTRRMLTMDFIHGLKITRRQAIEDAGMNPQEVAHTIAGVFGDMIHSHGYLHCDPHPGNLLVRPHPDAIVGTNNTTTRRWWWWSKPKAIPHQVVLLDHGMYRRLDPEFRLTYCELWQAFLTRDTKLGGEATKKLGLEPDLFDALSLVITWRPSGTAAPRGVRITESERQALRQKYKAIATPEELNRFLESLPRDMLFTLRSGDLVRGLNKELGGTSKMRLETLGEAAIRGLYIPNPPPSEKVKYVSLPPSADKEKDFRLTMQAAGIRCPAPLELADPYAPVNQIVSSELPYKKSPVRVYIGLLRVKATLWVADAVIGLAWWWRGHQSFTTRDIG